jgi:hypothetical protein
MAVGRRGFEMVAFNGVLKNPAIHDAFHILVAGKSKGKTCSAQNSQFKVLTIVMCLKKW